MSGATSRSASVRKADAEIQRLWLRRDPTALDRAHERYRKQLESVAYRILGNRADAEDVVQKIFLSLGRASYRGTASLWTYLYRAAVNGAVNVLRSKRRREAAEQRLLERQMLLQSSPAPPSPESQVLEGEVMAAVARALLQVKPQHRRVLTLRIVHGLSNTEIAEREAIPLATVGTWLRRGREELQRGLRPVLDELGGGTR
ncbi:MAG: sigma-70 family RNA polymerase sigma factor [Proteobacteria bacterium]|nr:sigma-70 family RNA polymerase sigma factor [Pseudomonadota bacterium]